MILNEVSTLGRIFSEILLIELTIFCIFPIEL